MSKRKPPAVKPSERKRAGPRSPESSESKAFRRAMNEPSRDENRLNVQVVFVSEPLDVAALAEVCRIEGSLMVEGAYYPVIEPTRPFEDHTEFDRAVCKAGLTAFIRPSMPSDAPGRGTPIDPKTGKEDPTIRPPKVPWSGPGMAVLVEQASPGIRRRRGIAYEEPTP